MEREVCMTWYKCAKTFTYFLSISLPSSLTLYLFSLSLRSVSLLSLFGGGFLVVVCEWWFFFFFFGSSLGVVNSGLIYVEFGFGFWLVAGKRGCFGDWVVSIVLSGLRCWQCFGWDDTRLGFSNFEWVSMSFGWLLWWLVSFWHTTCEGWWCVFFFLFLFC